MKNFLLALQFLTILPVRIKGDVDEKDFGRSLLYFPLVGLLIGLVLATFAFFSRFLSPLVQAAMILILSVVMTGGIHLDGFADTCDGFYGNKSKEDILRIMKDTPVGAMGVAGIVCLLLLKFALIASIPVNRLCPGLIFMAVFSRWCQVLACYASSYARQEGKAKYFIEKASEQEFLIGTLLTVALFFFLKGFQGIVILCASFLLIVLFMNYFKSKINGMTGDTIGALSEVAEVVMLFAVLF